MRKIGSLIIVMVMVLLSSPSQAFDICGNGAGGYFNGMLPTFDKNIMGLRYRSSGLTSYNGSNGLVSNIPVKERYHILEYWAAVTIKKKFRLMVNLPVGYMTQKAEYNLTTMAGISELSFFGFYNVFNNKNRAVDKESPSLSHNIWIGAGVKVPYPPADFGDNDFFSIGSGSIDYIIMGSYDLRYQNVGMNATASYKIGTKNRLDFAYGNRMTASTQFYYRYSIPGEGDLLPNLGFQYEHSGQNQDGIYKETYTGGTAFYGTIGLEISMGKFRLGGVFQPVLFQEVAQGKVKLNNRGMVNFSWLLGE